MKDDDIKLGIRSNQGNCITEWPDLNKLCPKQLKESFYGKCIETWPRFFQNSIILFVPFLTKGMNIPENKKCAQEYFRMNENEC